MTKMLRTTILLAGHGSRNRDGNDEIERFAAAWRERHPELRIDVCFIEHADVLLDEGLDRAARDADGVILVPLILNAAGHVKMEMPAAVAAARERHPKVRFVVARHLGMGRDILDVLQRQLNRQMRALNVPDPQTTGVILLGRGSSDASANGELARMARWVFEENDHELVDLAFTGVTWPRLETVVQRQIKLGMTQICILPVYLFTGVLIERIAAQVERLRQQYPQVAFAASSYFGFDAEIFDVLYRRLAEFGQSPEMLLECDGCKYRLAAQAEHLHDHSHTAGGAETHNHDHAHAHGHACAHGHQHCRHG